MDTILMDRDNLQYSDKPPVVIAASSDAAMRRARRTIESSGLRVGDTVAIQAARERMERQVSATALWIEVDEDCGDPLDALIAQVSRDVGDGRYAAVISATNALLDTISARLDDDLVELIVDADDTQRAAARAIEQLRDGAAALRCRRRPEYRAASAVERRGQPHRGNARVPVFGAGDAAASGG